MKKLISIFLVLSIVFFYNTGYFVDIVNIIQENFSKNDSIVSIENEYNKEMDIKTIDNFKKIKIGDSKAKT